MFKNSYFANNISLCDASKYPPATIREFKDLVKGRKICIWGAGQKGRGFLLALRRNGLDAEFFIDANHANISSYHDVEAISPEVLLSNSDLRQEYYIVTATVDIKTKGMHAELCKLGLSRGEDFDKIQSLSPYYPSVEVTGTCNLRCSSCPRGDSDILPAGGFMSLEKYQQIVNKMVHEMPFLYLVDLYMWGEPLLNPEIAEIIRYGNTLGIASGLSTNLNNISQLAKALEQKPALLRVSISGLSKETYEVTHTGGRWEKVENNLKTLSQLIKENGNKTIVEFYFHIYKHNVHEIERARSLCSEYGFRFHPALGIVFADYALRYKQTGKIPELAQTAADLLVRDIDDLLEECDFNREKSCILTRCVPNVDWDGSVKACCNYAHGVVADDYLKVPLDDIVKLRTFSDTCGVCQENSMHRWNFQTSYMEFVQGLIESSK